MIDSSPDLTKLLASLRFYLLIFDNIFCPPSRLLQQSSPTRRHSPDTCNGINWPMHSERSRFATDTKMRMTANNLTARGDEEGISRRYGKAGRPPSSSSDRIMLQRTCHQHIVFPRHLPPNMDHAGCVQQMPLSALSQIQECPRRHTRHTCPMARRICRHTRELMEYAVRRRGRYF